MFCKGKIRRERRNLNTKKYVLFAEIKFKNQEGALNAIDDANNVFLKDKKIFLKLLGESYSKYK